MDSSVLAILMFALAVVLWLCWRAVEWVWVRPKKFERLLRKQGFSGEQYRFLFGDTKEITHMREEAQAKPIPLTNDIFPRLFPYLHHVINTYGRNSFQWLGPVPLVEITDPKLIKEVFKKIDIFGKLSHNPASKLLAPGLISYEGEIWAKHRKLLNPAFHVQSLKLMFPSFLVCCVEMVTTWEAMVQEKGSIELDVWPHLTKLSSDTISRVAFGSSFEEGRKIFKLLVEQVKLTEDMVNSFYIPGWRFLPTNTNKRMNKLQQQIKTLLMGIIRKRKMSIEAGEEVAKDDLLGILMDNVYNSDGLKEKHPKKHDVGMTVDEMMDECKLFYFAGSDTTSSFLVWVIIVLSKHKEWQERAREEVLKTFGNNHPDFDGLNQLKTVSMIFNEVFRLYPPVTSLTRTVKQDVELGKFSLPAGIAVNVPILFVHQDPKAWGDDAKEFKPERFSEGILKATGGSNNGFLPFSLGQRICIGQNFALLEAKMAMAMILQRFSFEVSPSYTHAPTRFITTQPQHGAHILLHRL